MGAEGFSLEPIIAYLQDKGYEEGTKLSALDTVFSRAPREVRNHTVKTLSILMDWQVPPNLIIAALAHPVLELGLLLEKELSDVVSQTSMEVATKLITFYHEVGANQLTRGQAKRAQRMFKLRRYFVTAYQHPELILYFLADNLAKISASDALEGTSKYLFAEECEVILLPLLEMFGMWQLRREVGNRCLEVLRPGLYNKIEMLIEDGRNEKSVLFKEIQRELQFKLDRLGIEGEIHFHVSQPSSIYRRMLRGEPLETLAKQLKVDILVSSISDCYQVLGLIHSLWPSLSGRFKDLISSPKFNGYRNLLTWKPVPYKGKNGTKMVEFRIRTPQIEAINREGLVAAWYRNSTRERIKAAWWENQELREKVASMRLGSKPEPEGNVLVFTPIGQVFSLEAESTPIDYAFRVHTNLALYTKRIWVNGEPVDHSYQLRNGDVVQVEFDPSYSGPNPEWKNSVKTKTAEKAIERALTPHQKERKGRNIIEKVLEQEKAIYGFEISSQKLDAFLDRTSHKLGYESVEALYADVAVGKQSPNRIIRRLFEQELAKAIVTSTGERLPVPRERVWFAQFTHGKGKPCRVVPNVPIVGRLKSPGTPHERLIVYKRDCPNAPKGSDVIELKWKPETSQHEAAGISIVAWDKAKLLGKILDEVYALYGDDLYLYSAHADADPNNGTATIALTVDAPNFEVLYELSERLKKLKKDGIINNFTMVTLSPADKLKFGARDKRRYQNPYTEGVARGAMFVGRTEEQEKVICALESGTNLVVAHGEKRVGKTSLLRHLQFSLQQQGFLPVVVDMRGINSFSMPDLISEIVQQINEDIGRKIVVGRKNLGLPQLRAKWLHNQPFTEFERYLDRLQSRFPDRKLLIMLDEFNVLDGAWRRGELDRGFFSKLRAFIEKRKDISFILAIQDVVYSRSLRDRSGGWTALQNAMPLPLEYLDRESAIKLIREPKGDMLLYEDDVVDGIVELTYRHPYFLQIICRKIVDRKILKGGTRVTKEDLGAVLPIIYRSGRVYFHHFLELATGHKMVILEAIAKLSAEGKAWVNVGEIRDVCCQLGESLSWKRVNELTKELFFDRVLLRKRGSGGWRYRIRVPLFEKWLIEEYSF